MAEIVNNRLENRDAANRPDYLAYNLLEPDELNRPAPFARGFDFKLLPTAGIERLAVWPGNKGLLKERLSQGQRIELSADGPFLNETTRLMAYQDGLLALTDNRLWKLTLA